MKRSNIGLFFVGMALVFIGCQNPAADPVTDPPMSTNADLSALTVDGGTLSPVFSAGTTVYSVSVSNSVTSMTVTGSKADSTATVSANNGVAQALSVGTNTITITVTAQDDTTVKNYVVTVTRAAPDSTNADLSALTIDSGTLSPVFAAGTTDYTASVANSVTSMTVTGSKADSTATVSANNGVSQALSVGANTITITVTAQDGTTVKNYVVNVTRAASTNANLSALTVSSGTLSPVFAAGTTAYSVSVANVVTSITVMGTKADTGATLSTNNGVSQALSVGANTITISVTAQDGTTVKNYVVTVTRAASTNANLSALTVSSGTLSPVFAAGTTAYSVSVTNAVTSITVMGTKADTGATLSTNNGVSQALSVGANSITITVTAQDGTTIKNYLVTVTRAGAPGTLDTSFGTGGKVTTAIWTIGPGEDFANAVAIQTDGKIIVAGCGYNGGVGYTFALVCYLTNGTLDSSFGTGGKVTTILSTNDVASAMAIQSNGKILVAGGSYNANADFALSCYETNGALDTSFGTGGKVTTAIRTYHDTGYAVAIQTDGKIVVVGDSDIGSNGDIALARYNTNGTLDVTFDTDGKITTAIGSGDDEGKAIAIQSDGKIVVSGRSYNSSNYDFTLVSYETNGALDSSFGTGGKITTAIGSGNDEGYAMVIQADGKIVVVGYSNNSTDTDIALARYGTNGALDSTFGTGGKITTSIGTGYGRGYAVAIQTDGKIVVVGSSSNGSNSDFALARYWP
jgi:uncharacterized delta-60 repeat protein